MRCQLKKKSCKKVSICKKKFHVLPKSETGSLVVVNHTLMPHQGAWLGGRFSRLSGLVSKAASAEKYTGLCLTWQCLPLEVCSKLATGLGALDMPVASCAVILYCHNSCVAAAAEWRDKKELIGAMEAAIPFTERGAGGADVWPLQLRNNWTRHVPLGNMFSGLFMEIKEKTQAEQAA